MKGKLYMYKKILETMDKSSTLSSIVGTVGAAIIIGIINIEFLKDSLNFKIPIWLILLILVGYFLKNKLLTKANSNITKNILDREISITIDDKTNLDNITLSKDILCYSKDVFEDPISNTDIIFTWNYNINNEGIYPVNITFLCPCCNKPMSEFEKTNDRYLYHPLITPNKKNELVLACSGCVEDFEFKYNNIPSVEVYFSYEKKYYYDMIKKIEDRICTKISK